jgi:hypothetical protein
MDSTDTLTKIQYNLVNKGSRAAIAFGTRSVLKRAWKFATNKEAPLNPATPGVVWKEALLWGALTGLVVGVLRVAARRATAHYWRENYGAKPEDW